MREATSAYEVKQEKPVMVVMGNPPLFWALGQQGRVDCGVDQDIYKRRAVFEVEWPKPGEQAKWLNDDYVKFIRFAQWRIERTGEGVLGFVTNHSYLDNPTFRGMRHSLMETFDEIYLLDLHGNTKKKERTPDGGKDENVFDIQQGVAIGLFVKCKDADNGLAKVFHADLWGEREAGQMTENMAGSPPTASKPLNGRSFHQSRRCICSFHATRNCLRSTRRRGPSPRFFRRMAIQHRAS